MSDENSRVSGEVDLSEEETEMESESELESESESESEEDEGFSSEDEEECLAVESERGTLSSNKRIKEISIDRVSALPDSLLIHILSFLRQEAGSTCVLSKRWQYLWTELPRLEFISSRHNGEQTRMFGAMVDSVVANHRGNNLESFSVSLYYDKSLAPYIDVWIDFVVKKKVKEVVMYLSFTDHGHEYTLPQMMYSNSSVTSLKLEMCTFYPKGTIMWPSLTTLHLEEMEILECVIKKILVGCPALDSLSLIKCWGFNCLEIHSSSVRTLKVEDWDYDEEALVEIDAPYVHFLDILVFLVGKKFRLRNISSVLTAYFNINGDVGNEEIVGLMSYTKDLFVSLQHIKKLELGCEAIKVLAMLDANGCEFPQSRQLECLIIEAYKEEESISGILTLLESSLSLETLVIKGGLPCFMGYIEEAHPPGRGDLDCDLLHLRTVNITNFAFKVDGAPMLKLAQVLLKRATVLEKMVIEDYQISSRKSSANFIKIALTLLSYPRSSQQAVVLLRDYPHTTM